MEEKFEDTKGIIRIRKKSKKDGKYNGQKKKDKTLSKKQYSENYRWSNTSPTKNRG